MEIRIKTLTPLWTGGIDGTCDRVHETGIIGSLRWWYEAIVRGLGGWACDQENDKCELSGQKLEQYKAARKNDTGWWDALEQVGVCDACKVFGTTGWRRRFRVDIQTDGAPAWTGRGLNIKPQARRRGWYLNPGFMGQVILRVAGEPEVLAQIAALVRFLAQWGSIGAKPQLGYGFLDIESIREGEHELKDTSLEEIARIVGKGKWCGWQELRKQLPTANGSLPDLRAFTFFRAHFQPRQTNWWRNVDGLRQAQGQTRAILPQLAAGGTVPVSPTLKNYWRFQQKWPSISLEQWLFGTLRRDYRVRGKVGVSWAIQQLVPAFGVNDVSWLIRGWVWLPRDAQSRTHYAAVVNTMRQVIEDKGHWLAALNLRGSARDLQVTVHPGKAAWGLKDAQTICDFVNGEEQ